MADKASSQQTADALFLFDALRHVASPVVVRFSISLHLTPPALPTSLIPHSFTCSLTSLTQINASEIAAQKSAKVNTVQKRFSVLKQRYPDLNIQTTTTTVATTTPIPAKPARPAKVTKTPASKKTATANTKMKKASAAKVAAIAEQLEDESDKGSAKAVAIKSENGEDEEDSPGMLASSEITF